MLKYFDEGAKGACALLLGGFDGFHRGHERLLEAARETGLPVGLTALSGGKGGELFPLPEREDIFRALGFAFVDEHILEGAVRETSAEDFLKDLFSRIPAKAVFCGEDFRFGKDASGTPALLKEKAPCPVTVLPLAAKDGPLFRAGRSGARPGGGAHLRLPDRQPASACGEIPVERGRVCGAGAA